MCGWSACSLVLIKADNVIWFRVVAAKLWLGEPRVFHSRQFLPIFRLAHTWTRALCLTSPTPARVGRTARHGTGVARMAVQPIALWKENWYAGWAPNWELSYTQYTVVRFDGRRASAARSACVSFRLESRRFSSAPSLQAVAVHG